MSSQTDPREGASAEANPGGAATEPGGLDAYSPAAIARRVESAGIAKVDLPAFQTFVLAVLGGAFIAFGAMLFVVVTTNSGLGFGLERLVGGIAFSLGLFLVLVGGAELFTGNSLILFGWADGRIALTQLLRNWGLVYLGNFAGASATALLVHWSGIHLLANGAVGVTVVRIIEAKLALTPLEMVVRGILCNVLVCLAVWLCFAARSVGDKLVAILFPVAAFVALGFEHSIANMYLFPAGWLAGSMAVTPAGYLANLLLVTVGNVIGGGALVALVYWLVYGRPVMRWTRR